MTINIHRWTRTVPPAYTWTDDEGSPVFIEDPDAPPRILKALAYLGFASDNIEDLVVLYGCQSGFALQVIEGNQDWDVFFPRRACDVAWACYALVRSTMLDRHPFPDGCERRQFLGQSGSSYGL